MKSLIISNLSYDLLNHIETHIFDDLKCSYDDSEKYYIISKEKIQELIYKVDSVNMWLSVALGDDKICKEMKDDINYWFKCFFTFIKENNIQQNTFYNERSNENKIDEIIEL